MEKVAPFEFACHNKHDTTQRKGRQIAFATVDQTVEQVSLVIDASAADDY